MKLIYNFQDQNIDSNKKTEIIQRLSSEIYEIYPIPSKIVKVLSLAISEINDYK